MSSDFGESIATLSLIPDEINTVQAEYPAKIETVMKIKDRGKAKFQIDTTATCNVINACKITGTKYANQVTQTTQMLKMFNSTTLRPIENAKSKFATPKVTRSTKSPSWSYQMKPVLASSLGAQPHSGMMGFLDTHFEQLRNSLAAPKP